jgi:bile acid:Na+ symporter, BASS family
MPPLAFRAMSTQQLALSLVLMVMVFTVALELRVVDFKNVGQTPRAVLVGLLAQFILLPGATWLATLALDLPANTEAAMILVACCPGGALSNYVTHYGRGNTALSISISAVAALLALVLTPFNFSWMVASNPATAGWLKQLDIDASGIWWSLLILLGLPMTAGLFANHRWPEVTRKLRKPLGRFSVLALFAFIALALWRDRAQLDARILMPLVLVIAHNALGLGLGGIGAWAFRLDERDRRAVIIEGGMQNSGLALGIIAVQFDANLGMVVIASLWGMWHIVSGFTLATLWRRKDARSGH